MKIAFINIYQDGANRGVETFIHEVSTRLRKNNHVEIISGGKESIPEWKKSFLWRAFLDPNSLAIARFTLSKLGKIWKEKYDVVIPVNGGWQPAFVRIVTWLYGGKMVISGQSGIGWHDRNNLWCLPDAFIGLSTKALNWAKRATPFIRSSYIPNGVDLQKFKPKVTKDTQKTVLCVGAFTSQKRISLAIDAVAKLKDVNLLVAGGGGDKKKETIDYGTKELGERFNAISVPFNQMPDVYRKADVFTLPSETSEAFGNVLVEAMASGLPVVATDDTIRKEIVGNAGILVDPTDTEEYAKALKEALETNWGDKPRKQAEKFSWDEIANKYEELFKTFFKQK